MRSIAGIAIFILVSLSFTNIARAEKPAVGDWELVLDVAGQKENLFLTLTKDVVDSLVTPSGVRIDVMYGGKPIRGVGLKLEDDGKMSFMFKRTDGVRLVVEGTLSADGSTLTGIASGMPPNKDVRGTWTANRKPVAATLYETAKLDMRVSTNQLVANIAHLDEVIAAAPKNIDAYLARGIRYSQWGLLSGVRSEPTEPALPLLDKAIADFTKAIALKKTDFRGFLGRGNAYVRRADFGGPQTDSQHAVADFTAAIKLAPNEPEPYEARATLYYFLKREDEAKKDGATSLRLRSAAAKKP